MANELERGYFAERSNAIGLVKDGEVVAGVIYENWNGRSIVVHIAVKGRLTPAFIAAIFHYAFSVCRVEKVIATIEDTNLKSIRLVTNMGFTEECRIRDAHPDGDFLVMTMKKSDCRFLGERYARRI